MGAVADLLTGRRRVRVLVRIDTASGEASGGRALAGPDLVEFTEVVGGSRVDARTQAIRGVRARLAETTAPHEVVAVLDGGPVDPPEPSLHLTRGGGRRRLLLVGADGPVDLAVRLRQAVNAWGLPDGEYRLGGTRSTGEWIRERRAAAIGLLLGLPVAVLAVVRVWPGAATGGPEPSLWSQVFTGPPAALVAVLVIALGPAATVAVLERTNPVPARPRRGRRLVAMSAALPAVAVALVFSVVDGSVWLSRQFPLATASVLLVVCLIAAPVAVTAVPAGWARAAAGWGLPLLAGGVALFVGELRTALYLGAFGTSTSDVQLSPTGLWATGAWVLLWHVAGLYVVGAVYCLLRRFLGRSAIGAVTFALVGLLVFASVLAATFADLGDAVRGDGGTPRPLPSVSPRWACFQPTGPDVYSTIGGLAPVVGAPVLLLGRSDGRLALWSPETGPSLVDGPSVTLRIVEDRAACS